MLGSNTVGGNPPFERMRGALAHAWMHLWSMSIAIPKLKAIAGDIAGDAIVAKARENAEAAFYWGKILSDRFYLGTELKHLYGYLDYIMAGEPAVGESFEDIFTGALSQ